MNQKTYESNEVNNKTTRHNEIRCMITILWQVYCVRSNIGPKDGYRTHKEQLNSQVKYLLNRKQ